MCPVMLGWGEGGGGFGISPVWREKGEQEHEREKKIFNILSKVPQNFISLAQISP